VRTMTSRASNSSQSSQSSVQGSYRLADSDSDEEIETIEHSAALQTKELNEVREIFILPYHDFCLDQIFVKGFDE
jgi:hypothetical protein